MNIVQFASMDTICLLPKVKQILFCPVEEREKLRIEVYDAMADKEKEAEKSEEKMETDEKGDAKEDKKEEEKTVNGKDDKMEKG